MLNGRVVFEEKFENQRQTATGQADHVALVHLVGLRNTAAPGRRWGRAGTGFARAGGVGALGYTAKPMLVALGKLVPFWVRPNPSVKRTHNGGARLRASATSAAPARAAFLQH